MSPPPTTLVPEQFGPLHGVRILSTGTIMAEPVAAGLAAEMGAEVIHIERPKEGEDWRHAEFPIVAPDGELVASSWVQDHRNMYHTTLDFSTPEGRDIFLQLVRRADSGWKVPRRARTTSGAWTTRRMGAGHRNLHRGAGGTLKLRQITR